MHFLGEESFQSELGLHLQMDAESPEDWHSLAQSPLENRDVDSGSLNSESLNDSMALPGTSGAASSPPTVIHEQVADSESNCDAELQVFQKLDESFQDEPEIFIKREKEDDWSENANYGSQTCQSMGAIFPVKIELIVDPNRVDQSGNLLEFDVIPLKRKTNARKRRPGPKCAKTATGNAPSKKKPPTRKRSEPKTGGNAKKKVGKTSLNKDTSTKKYLGSRKPANNKTPAKKGGSVIKSSQKRKSDAETSGLPAKRKRGRPAKASKDGRVQKGKKTASKSKTCSVCGRTFVRLDFYERHIAMHDSTEKKRTGKRKTTPKEADIGKKPRRRKAGNVSPKAGKAIVPFKVKLKPKEYVCSICSRTFNKRASWVIHKQTHVQDRLKCDLCEKSFSSSVLLSSHRWMSHKEETGHLCVICKKVFRKKIDLTYHFRVHSGEKPHLCSECGKSFARSKDLTEHLRKHTGEKPYCCSECGAMFSTTSSFCAHKKRHKVTPFQCARCPKRFSEESLFQLHMEMHNQQTMFACTSCDKAFLNEGSLTLHLKEKHYNQASRKTFQCNICNKVFSRQFSLKSHVNGHLGTRPFKCDLCEKSFTVRSHLATHMRGHGSSAYKCDYCSLSFPFESDLHLHKRTEHRETLVDKECTCHICGKTFSKASGLKRHILVHTGEKKYLCDVCGKACKTTSELGQHKKCHSNSKPYVCPHCGKAFTFNGNLTVHVRVHTGETPYQCGLCGKTFNQKSNLVTHEIRKHGLGAASKHSTDVLVQYVEDHGSTLSAADMNC